MDNKEKERINSYLYLSGRVLLSLNDKKGRFKHEKNLESLKDTPLYSLALFDIAKYVAYHDDVDDYVVTAIYRYGEYLAIRDNLPYLMDKTPDVELYDQYVVDYASKGDEIAILLINKKNALQSV